MTLYWRIFNFLARRVVAPAFVVGGLFIAAVDAPSLLPGGTIQINGAPSSDFIMRFASVALPLLASALGIALFRAEPFHPRSRGNA